MKKQVNYSLLQNSIVLNFSGETTLIGKDDPNFLVVKDLIKEGREDEIPALLEAAKAAKAPKGGPVRVENGVMTIHGRAVPSRLHKKVEQFMAEGLPLQPILNLWERIIKNPSYSTIQQVFDFLDHNGHPITPDGQFIAYKAVTMDFKDIFTRTFDNSPGATPHMDRNEVVDDPNQTCSKGLHVASWGYLKHYGGTDKRIVECLVSPEHVVSVPTDYNNTKMRVTDYTVIGEVKEESLQTLREIWKKRDEERYLVDCDDEEELYEDYDDDGYCPDCDSYFCYGDCEGEEDEDEDADDATSEASREDVVPQGEAPAPVTTKKVAMRKTTRKAKRAKKSAKGRKAKTARKGKSHKKGRKVSGKKKGTKPKKKVKTRKKR